MIHDPCCHSGFAEQFLVVGVGRDKAALDGAFQKQCDNEAVHHGKIAADELETVEDPEDHSADHDDGGQLLKAFAARHTAFFQKCKDKVEAQEYEPCHGDEIDDAVVVVLFVGFQTVGEGEGQLMQIIREYAGEEKGGGDIQAVHPLGHLVLFTFADVVGNEEAHKRNENHGDVVCVPAPAAQRLRDIDHKLPFTGSHRQPEGQQDRHGHQVPAYLPVDDPCFQGDAPGDDKGDLNDAAEHDHKRSGNGVGDIDVNCAEIVCNHQQNCYGDGI